MRPESTTSLWRFRTPVLIDALLLSLMAWLAVDTVDYLRHGDYNQFRFFVPAFTPVFHMLSFPLTWVGLWASRECKAPPWVGLLAGLVLGCVGVLLMPRPSQ